MSENNNPEFATNIEETNQLFDLSSEEILPALLRKIYLGKCLDEDNWDAIRNDLNQRPIEDVDGAASEEEILEILNYHGVYDITSANGEKSAFIQLWASADPHLERQLANVIKDVVGYNGFFRFAKTKADGSPVNNFNGLKYTDEEVKQAVSSLYQQFISE